MLPPDFPSSRLRSYGLITGSAGSRRSPLHSSALPAAIREIFASSGAQRLHCRDLARQSAQSTLTSFKSRKNGSRVGSTKLGSARGICELANAKKGSKEKGSKEKGSKEKGSVIIAKRGRKGVELLKRKGVGQKGVGHNY